MEKEIRYWPRIGLYVSKTDAEEYISKSGGAGAVLDEEIEEFTPMQTTSPEALRFEIDALFEEPFEHGELSTENKAIIGAISMERSRISRIKELMVDGLSKVEAKATFEQELDEFVRQTLGLPDETNAEREYRIKYDEIHGGEEE
tara:strand:- start:1529 stop:1963 length:435 start_codon:yes stop_codon:yes gene_type:complete